MNALLLGGAVLAVFGVAMALALALRALALLPRWRKARRLPEASGGVWSGAVDAREVYVPGRITRRLAAAVLFLGLAALGLTLGLAGHELEHEYVKVDGPKRIGTVTATPAGAGAMALGYHESDHTWGSGAMPGTTWALYGDSIVFAPELAPLGLTAYVRATQLRSYARSADILANKPLRLLDLRKSTRLFEFLDRHAKSLSFVQIRRHWSQPRPATGQDQAIFASRDGFAYSPDGR